MKLVVFDLDGTLTATNAVDNECYIRACSESLGITALSTVWTDYEHVTDLGVINQAFSGCFGRTLEPEQISSFIEYFLGLLVESYAQASNHFAEIPGATSFLNRLSEDQDWRVALATGGWERSARYKIQKAGFNIDGIPAAFSEDGPSREAIVRTAISRAEESYGQSFERIVSVGDALWDVQAAKRTNLPFVGVATGERAARLRSHRASHVIENFLDHHHCFKCLDEATVPGTPYTNV